MPRPKKPGVEPKRRSRNGCWPCKARKVKCGEEKPRCVNCERQGETCDYSIRLNWGGRIKRTSENTTSGASSKSNSPHMSTISFDEDVSPLFPPVTPDAPFAQGNNTASHTRARSANSLPTSQPSPFDPEMEGLHHTTPPPPPPPHSMMVTIGPFERNNTFGQNMQQQQPHDSNRQHNSAHFEPQTQTQFRGTFEYPSPSGSTFDTFSYTTGASFTSMNAQAPLSPPPMPPPVRGDPMYKRHKTSYSVDSPATISSMSASETYSPNSGPYSPFMGMPLTPGSSISSEEPIVRIAPKSTGSAYVPPDLRRLSVQSLLAGPPGENSQAYSPDAQHSRQYPIGDAAATTYGFDLGHPDLDTPRNDDLSAIAVYSPPSGMMSLDDETTYGNAEPRSKDMAFERGGYYASPVPIRISKSLEPLPPILMENPMNLLYFHHFLNHTARILVPHDCEKNPFRQILPEMAVHDDNIMNLLLAYSAAHRARMLNHEEPVNRIAVWVKDVFPKLRESLTNPHQISNTALAPAIMMASLEIISPNTFEVPISWQSHLTMARQMIIARGGPRTMDRHDRVAYFLSRWFAYLDVLGSLSGNKNDQPLGSFYWSSENASADEDFQIDCLMGFTNRCVGSLARIAELAKQCEPQRIDTEGNIREDWRPSPEIVGQAIAIRRELEEGLSDQYIHKGCNHRSSDSSESEGAWDATEIYATNEMFHWAGLIHLYRRVLGKPANDAEVQHAVREILGLLYKVRRGSTAEACLLFPMFAAGCDALNQGQREKIMERLRCVEAFGMTQVHKARALMQKVWDTGKPWESLVEGEFFG